MKTIFNWITTLSLRFRWITLALVAVFLGLGVTAYSQMNQELLPPIELPQSFILAQANGMTSQQVSMILTEQLERKLAEIEEIINTESNTTGSFGSSIIAYNDFGINQSALQDEIRDVIFSAWHSDPDYVYSADDMWFPLRGIGPQNNQDERPFAAELLGDLTPEIMLYLIQNNGGFLFQLEPDVWEVLSDETVRALATYLASTTQESNASGSALERFVSHDIAPQIAAVTGIADTQIAGGQSLDPNASQQESISEQSALLLRLSPEVWEIIATRFDGIGALNQDSIDTILSENIELPEITDLEAPPLPESWQFPHFENTDDLLELETLTESIGTILNNFQQNGFIIGALGQTSDLTANDITNLLALESAAGIPLEESLVNYFEAQHLLALPQDAFDSLPAEYLENLDDFTSDQLTNGNEDGAAMPVELPRQWQIPAPQLITFSFADFPLATYSIASTDELVTESAEPEATAPTLPQSFQQIGEQFGIQLNDADDLLNLQLPEAMSALASSGEFGPAQLFNFIASPLFSTLIPKDQLPEGMDTEMVSALLLSSLNEDIINYLDENDPDFMTSLSEDAQAAIFGSNTDEGGVPGLNPQWTTIANFNENFDSLTTSDDLINFEDGFAYRNVADLVNEIMSEPGGQGFAPELLGNWPVASIQYILEQEPTALDGINDEALRFLPEDAISLLPDYIQQRAESVRNSIVPKTQVTRTNGQESLLFTVFKDSDANTVSTFHAVDDIIQQIDAANDSIEITVVNEQSSFVEESISGVAREGSLGAVFAIIIILIFLSSGVWGLRGRRLAAMIMIVAFILGLIGLTALNLGEAGSWGEAFSNSDIVLRVLLITGIVVGIAVLFYPSDLPDPAWRATIVIAISIPLSILTAFALMKWLSPAMFNIIQPLSERNGTVGDIFTFVLRLFPDELTLNLMTLSGLTVAVGRVVDDSIVVLENIFRQLQAGGNKRDAVLSGTRDVSAAIFTATVIAVVVFLPLGLTGGIVGAFFLPFGLAITYALAASFIVAITVVPVLAYLTIDTEDIPEDKDIWIADFYLPVLRWSLNSWKTKSAVIVIAFVSAIFGMFLFGTRPFAFLPGFGEPQVLVNVELPANGARITDTNIMVEELEAFIFETYPQEEIISVQTTVGGFGASFESLFGGNRVYENRANVTVGLDVPEETLDERTQEIREKAEEIFAIEGDDQTYVTVSASTVGGDFGGFALVVSGDPDTLEAIDPLVKNVLEGIEGITNVSSNLPESTDGQTDAETEEIARTKTLIRVNQQSALSYSAELETEDTIGITQVAIQDVQNGIATFANGEIPEGLELTDEQIQRIQQQPIEQLAAVDVSQGFQSEIQTEGFNSMPIAMGIATLIVVAILIFTFQSFVYWFAIILSIVVAPVGAAVALTITNRVLGISALIGLLMLLGLVVTNAVVLIDRVRSNRSERGMNLHDALVEGGGRRLRPILMTSIATIIALLPLAIGLSQGALIAAELGTVVIGGVVSSTLLTLIVVPVMYSLLHPVHRFLSFRKLEID